MSERVDIVSMIEDQAKKIKIERVGYDRAYGQIEFLEKIKNFEITQPSNKWVQKTNPNERYLTLSSFRCPKKGGRNLCKWCHESVVKHPRKYCGDRCSDSALIYCIPQNDFSKRYHLAKQGMCCNICGKIHASWFWENFRYSGPDATPYCLTTGEEVVTPHLDHIVPIHKGGRSIGLDNVQVICPFCHNKKSASEARERGAQK